MSSKIKVDTIENVAGSGNVSLGSGHNLVVPGNITGQGTAAITSNATVGGTLGVTGDLTVDTSTLKVDSSNNRVGVGTASPTVNFEVQSSGNTFMFVKDSSSGSGLYLKAASNGAAEIQTAGGNNTIGFRTSGQERCHIDASGRVTMPNQPAFFATAESNIPMSNSYSELTAFSNGQVNVGTHYNTSNGRFTAPVAGTYQFAVASIGNSNADVYRFRFYKNGSSLHNYELRIHTEGGAYGTNGEMNITTTLAASDYISIFGRSDGGNNAYGDAGYRYTYFRGHLMG